MTVRPIRIALLDLPRMVEDIVGTLVGGAPEADVVATVRHGENLARELRLVRADLVICSIAEQEMEAIWEQALQPCISPAFLNLGGGFTRGDLYGMHATRRRLEEVSGASLVEALRDHDSWSLLRVSP